MIIKTVELKISAFNESQYPKDGIPQIALLGRSNVGKSSFINAILNRNNFARVSSRPGKTQGINFYIVNNFFYLADLPGYGYAQVPKSKKDQWSRNIEKYLNTSKSLIGAIMLVDIRRVPNDDDLLMIDYLKSREINFIVVATKSDKLKKSEIMPSIEKIRNTLGIDSHDIIIFSSLKKQGVDKVYDMIEKILAK